jgi:hypothetical protein
LAKDVTGNARWNGCMRFSDVIQKASNQDLFFRAVIFYLDEQPMLINDLLKNISLLLIL